MLGCRDDPPRRALARVRRPISAAAAAAADGTKSFRSRPSLLRRSWRANEQTNEWTEQRDDDIDERAKCGTKSEQTDLSICCLSTLYLAGGRARHFGRPLAATRSSVEVCRGKKRSSESASDQKSYLSGDRRRSERRRLASSRGLCSAAAMAPAAAQAARFAPQLRRQMDTQAQAQAQAETHASLNGRQQLFAAAASRTVARSAGRLTWRPLVLTLAASFCCFFARSSAVCDCI